MTEVLDEAQTRRPGPSRRWMLALPVLGFAGLAALLAGRLSSGDPGRLPSALIGQPVPDFTLPGVSGLQTPGRRGLAVDDLKAGHVTVLNVFASWCVECHEEHEALLALASGPELRAHDARLVGIAYKDDPDNARRYLGAKGNPFTQVGADQSGRFGIELGVYGIPETFVIRGDGTIAYKLVGGVTASNQGALLAAVAAAR